MDIDLLKSLAVSFAGEKARGVIDLLHGKKKVDEFFIAKKLGITVNQARNLFYKLADAGMASFTKKKDRKKGGWYSYSWSLNESRSLLKAEDSLLNVQKHLRQQLERKRTERFYTCPNGDLEMQEEDALLHQYTCPECGEVLHIKDHSKEISALEKDIAKHEDTLQAVRSELQVLNIKHGKNLARKQRAEDKKKKIERSAQRKKRIREKKKIKNKGGKKNSGNKLFQSRKKRKYF